MSDNDEQKHGPVQYWWFEGESVEELKRQLNATHPARLEVHPVGRKIMLNVSLSNGDTRIAAGEPINESHPCPPWC